jgi:hypothetical protein
MRLIWIAPLLAATLSSGFGQTPSGGQSMDSVLARIGKDASKLWSTAPDYVARETWRQKTTSMPESRIKLHLGDTGVRPPQPVETVRETVSLYALAPYHKSPESLWEFRRILSVDGKTMGDPAEARREFLEKLGDKDDKAKHKLREKFLKQGVAGTAFDFGQILMLFTKPRLGQYTFSLTGTERIGADNALKVSFEQQLGSQALHVTDRGKRSAVPLRGEILVRDSDYAVLQIRVLAEHSQEGHEVRDEARVDYAADAGGALLPASVVHKRFVDNKTDTEDLFQYSDWRSIRANQ